MTTPEVGAEAGAGSLLDRARAAYRAQTAKPTNDVPVLADPETGEQLLWLRLGIPSEAQTTIARQMMLDQGAGRKATSVRDHAEFVGACVQDLGVANDDPAINGAVKALTTAAGGPVSWVPYVAQITDTPCASPEQAIIALYSVPGENGGPPRLDTQRLAEVSDMHRLAVLADTRQARAKVTDPGA